VIIQYTLENKCLNRLDLKLFERPLYSDYEYACKVTLNDSEVILDAATGSFSATSALVFVSLLFYSGGGLA